MNGPALTATELDFLHGVLDLARSGRSAELAQTIDAGVPVNLTNGAGDSLLILAAYHCYPDMVAMLIARRADTERTNDRGQTALAAAVFRRHAQIVDLLLSAGADPSAGSRSAWQIATFFGLDDMATLLAASSPLRAAPTSTSQTSEQDSHD